MARRHRRIPPLLIATLRQTRVDVYSAARQVGMDATLRSPVAEEQIDAWLARMAPSLPCEFGLQLGATVQAESLGLIGLAARFSENLGESLGQLAGHTLLGDEVGIFRERKETLLVIRSYGDVAYARKKADCIAASLLAIARQLTGQALAPVLVTFAFPPPETIRYRSRYRELAPSIQFEAGLTTLVIANGDLARPVIGAGPELAEIFRRHAAEGHTETSEFCDISSRARASLRAHLFNQPPTLSDLALFMGVPEGPLRFRLNQTPPRFLALIEEVRKERALLLLRHGRYTNEELASLIGADENGLRRLVRRWTGLTPNEARRALAP